MHGARERQRSCRQTEGLTRQRMDLCRLRILPALLGKHEIDDISTGKPRVVSALLGAFPVPCSVLMNFLPTPILLEKRVAIDGIHVSEPRVILECLYSIYMVRL